MSLKSWLAGKSSKEVEFQNIIKQIQPKKSQLKSLSGKLPFSKDFSMLAPYNLTISSYAMTVGTAFDYLARFQIAQIINQNKEKSYEKLVAERFFLFFKPIIDSKIYQKLHNKYDESIEYITKFVHSNAHVNTELIQISYFLALLERSRRSGILSENLNSYLEKAPNEIVDDLFNLTSVFNNNFIKNIVTPESDVIFNPHFGSCSKSVGGADADIYIDGTLYDFKCTKKNGYVGKDWQQIISYYIFEQINLRREDKESSFNKNHEIPRW